MLKPEKLYTLAVILVVLVVAGLIFKRKPGRVDLAKQYEVHALVPDGFTAADVARAEFYRGKDASAGVRLSRVVDDKGSPTGWKVDSRFEAPGDAKKVDDFLKEVRDKQGEFRTDRPEALPDFELTDDKAFHIVLYKKDAQEPALHLLVGKTEGYQGGFVRRAGENTVYSVNANFRSSLGIWGNDENKQPDSTEWINKVFLDLDRDKIARVELTYPDKKLALEKKTIEPPKKEGEKDGEKEKTPPKKETKWELVAGGPKVAPDGKVAALTDHGPNTILNALDSLRAADVVDPAKKREYGLEQPAYRCEVAMEDGKKYVVVAGRPEAGGDAFVVLEGKEKPVFKMERYTFENLFHPGADLFELKGPDLKEEEVERVRVQLASGAIAFARPKGETQKGWTLAEPAVAPPPGLVQDKIDQLLERFCHWRPADYSDADAAAAGLDKPEAVIEVFLRSGKSWRLALGKPTTGLQGRATALSASDAPAGATLSPTAMTAADAALALAPIGSYLDLKAVASEAAQIAKISATRPDQGFVIARKVADGKAVGPWMLQAPDGEHPTNAAKVDALVNAVVALAASDIRFGPDASAPPPFDAPVLTYKVETAAGQTVELAIGAEKDGHVLARPGDRPWLLVFPPGVPSDIAPDPATLAAEPPKKEEPKKEEPKKEEPKKDDPAKEPGK